jgi:hypothetical protein
MAADRPVEITADDIAALVAAGAIALEGVENADMFMLLMTENEAVMDAIRKATQDTANEAYTRFYNSMRDAISGDLSKEAYDKALNLADDAARIQAKTFAVNISRSDLQTMGKVVADGLAEGLDPKAIGRRLNMVKGLDPRRAATYQKMVEYMETLDITDEQLEKRAERLYQKLLRERKAGIAQHEARIATEHAREAEAKADGARWKTNITSGGPRVCSICQDNEAAGSISINEPFPSGHDTAPFHPGSCACSVAYGTSDAQKQRMDEHAAARAESTATAKEAA